MADLVIVGIQFPTESNGQMFFQVDTGQVWAYLGGSWSPTTGGDAYNLEAPISVFINGVNRNANIKLPTVSIKNNLTSKVDTASFMFYDHGDYAIRPDSGYQIDIFSYDTNDKLFSGEILKMRWKDETQGLLQFEYNIQCVDYTKRLAKRLIIEDYTSQTAGYIIKDIIDNYYNEFSYINVVDGPTIDFVSFNYMTGDNAIRKIAKLTGYDWYVDVNKDIHFFLPATNYTPYILKEDLSDGNFVDLTFSKDKSNYKNKVYLQGGSYLEAYTGDIQVADGEQTTFNLAYEPYSPVVVSVDTGGGFVLKTLGIDNIDTSGFDFVVNQSEKCIRNLDLAKLNSGDIVKVTYFKKVKIIVYDEDTTSQTDIQAREGGDGIYEYKLNDDTIADLATARDRITAEIADFKDPLISGFFITNQYGYQSGQILRVELASYGFASDSFKVQSVSIKPKIPVNDANRFYVEYNVQFQSFDRSFDDFLINMYSNSVNKEIVVKGDEKLTT